MIGQQLKMDVGTQEPKGVSRDSVTVSKMGGHKMGGTQEPTISNGFSYNKCEEALMWL